MVQEGLNATLYRYNGVTAADRSITRAWDEVQERLECCGISSVENWLEQNSTALGRPYGFPLSCCSDGASIVNDTCALSQVYSDVRCNSLARSFSNDGIHVGLQRSRGRVC